MRSRDVSWRYCKYDQKLSDGPCELIYVAVVPSSATTDSALYNGVNTSGDLIVDLKAAAVTVTQIRPEVPIYCEKGLFVDFGTNVTGIFVQWRELGNEEGE